MTGQFGQHRFTDNEQPVEKSRYSQLIDFVGKKITLNDVEVATEMGPTEVKALIDLAVETSYSFLVDSKYRQE